MNQGELEESRPSSDADLAAAQQESTEYTPLSGSTRWIDQLRPTNPISESEVDRIHDRFVPSKHSELSSIGRKLVIAWEAAAGGSSGWDCPFDLGTMYARGYFNSTLAQLTPHIGTFVLFLIALAMHASTIGWQLYPTFLASLMTTLLFSPYAAAALAGWVLRPKAYARRVNEALGKSNIVERLLLHDQELTEITNRVPWLFRLTFGSYRKFETMQTARLIAYNLDWYLWPRRLLIRFQWFINPLCIVLPVLGMLGMFFQIPVVHSQNWLMSPGYILLLLLHCAIVLSFFTAFLASQRRVIHCDALIAHFLARHAERQDKLADG